MITQRSRIFVFGSNLLGRHGKGAALRAKMRYGAEYGVAVGHIGQSYALPTKDIDLKPLDLFQIHEFAKQFIAYAKAHPELEFNVTQIGCGLAGHQAKDIAPMFEYLPNVWYDKAWQDHISGDCSHAQYFEGEL